MAALLEKENIFGRGMGRHTLWVGLLMGLVSLGMVFTTLTLSPMGHEQGPRKREREGCHVREGFAMT